MGVILFSYRPTDSKPISEWILERLKFNYKDEVVGDATKPRDDVRSYVDSLLGRDSVLVLVIGPRWVDGRSRQGTRYLDDDLDYIRVEVEVALAKGLPVLPVLVSDAKMPDADALPDDLKLLAHIAPLPFGSDAEFRGDMMRLHRRLAAQRAPLGKRVTPPEPSVAVPSEPRKDLFNQLARERLAAGKHPFEGVAIGTLGEVLWILRAQAGELGKNYGGRRFPPDLSGADLSNVNLNGADLSGAMLADTKLIQASLNGADLTGANLSGADLTEAILIGARLTGSHMHAAAVRLANLQDSVMEGTDLSDVDFTTTTLSGASMNGAKLQRAVLTQ